MPSYYTDAQIGVPVGDARNGMRVMKMAPFIVAVSEVGMSKEDGQPWDLDGAYILPLPKGWRPTHWQRTKLQPTCAFMPSEARPDGSALGQLIVALFSLN